MSDRQPPVLPPVTVDWLTRRVYGPDWAAHIPAPHRQENNR